jgi:cytochrome P450
MTEEISPDNSISQEPPVPTGKAGARALQALLRHRNILAALEALHKEMGNVFRITLPNFNPVVLVGPEANKFLLVTNRNDFRWRLENDPVTNLLRHGLLVEDSTQHDQLRHRMEPALHRNMLVGYVDTMFSCTDQVINTWSDGSKRDMLVEMRRIALLILVQSLFKVDFSSDLGRLWSAILRNIDYISPGPWLVWSGIPRPGYKKARQQLDTWLYEIIQARRAATGQADDLLGLLVTTPGMSDDLIRDQLLTMLIAGHDTSTALLAWALYLLGRHVDIMRRLQDEIDAIAGDNVPTYKTVSHLKYLDQVLKESLRLYPPIHAGMRIAATDLTFHRYHIPAGTRVLYSIYLSHRQEEYWPEPNKFDPERFSPEQNRNRTPLTYVPFGGGPRNCIGAAFGLVESKVVLTRIFQKFQLKLTQTNVHPHMGATLEPRPGVMMQVQHRGKV